MQPHLPAVDHTLLTKIYTRTNYAFLFAPNFHTGLKHIASIRRELPCPSIFNLLGPLTNPAEQCLEARVIGVKRRDLVDVFAQALLFNGTRKGMVVCGAEELDEVSCAGETFCARLVVAGDRDGGGVVVAETEREEGNAPGADTIPRQGQGDMDEVTGTEEVSIERFVLAPEDFGLPRHPLSEVSPGRTPEQNAEILGRLLRGGDG